MLHGIVEEHKVHSGVQFVVLTERISKSDCECVDVGELVVEFLIETTDEVGEDKRLRSGLGEVFGQVEFTE